MRQEKIEKYWAIYVVLAVSVMLFGAGYIHVTDTERFSTAVMDWIMTCILFGLPPNLFFFLWLTVFNKKKKYER